MKTLGAYEKCRLYIESHSHLITDSDRTKSNFNYPCVTISRETGAGADVVSERLVEYFQSYTRENMIQWTIFDRNLIEKVLQDHNLPALVSHYMHEDKYSNVGSAIHEMLGLQPSGWTLVHHTTETILQLARIGGVIIVGRGSNIITANLKNTFHVRLVAPMENKINHVMDVYNLNRKEATEFIRREDSARKNFVYSNFYKNVDDALQYHIVLNTGLLGYDEAAKLIGESVKQKFAGIFAETELRY